MGSVIPLKKEIDNSYLRLKNLAGDKLENVTQRIKFKLASEINLIHKMTDYHVKSGGKRIRPLLTLAAAKLFVFLSIATSFDFLIFWLYGITGNIGKIIKSFANVEQTDVQKNAAELVNKWQTIIFDEQQDGGTKSCDDIDTAATPKKDSVVESSARMDALNITVMVPMKKKIKKGKFRKWTRYHYRQ